jgi:glycine/D-amino acid oxidase-like deaminating enzyme
MTIYVDELFTMTPRTSQARRFGNRWCHLTTDGDLEELHKFAEKLGLRRSYFQPHATLAHYDLVPSLRAKAVKLGATEITTAERLKQAREKA